MNCYDLEIRGMRISKSQLKAAGGLNVVATSFSELGSREAGSGY